MGAEFHADRRTDGQTGRLIDRHDEGNSRYSQFCENPKKSHFMFNHFSENRAVYEIKVEKYGRAGHPPDDNLIWRMRIYCYVTKGTETLRICSTYCFPRKQWLPQQASLLLFTYSILTTFLTLIQRKVFRTLIVVYSANHFKKQALTPRELSNCVTLTRMVYMITTLLHKVV